MLSGDANRLQPDRPVHWKEPAQKNDSFTNRPSLFGISAVLQLKNIFTLRVDVYIPSCAALWVFVVCLADADNGLFVFVWYLFVFACQCSHSCGRGSQWRKVYCKQRLATGSYRRLRDEECPGNKPAAHRTCFNSDCLLPRLEGGEWSKVWIT